MPPPPTTLTLYVGLVVAHLAFNAMDDPGPLAGFLLVAILWALVLVGLWRGSRLAWALALLGEVLGLVITPLILSSPTWLLALLHIAGLALLLTPSVRDHVR